jgi:hypothetical protein
VIISLFILELTKKTIPQIHKHSNNNYCGATYKTLSLGGTRISAFSACLSKV